jgi:hypothetical protein
VPAGQFDASPAAPGRRRRLGLRVEPHQRGLYSPFHPIPTDRRAESIDSSAAHRCRRDRLHDFYTWSPTFDQAFTRIGITFPLSKVRVWRTKMDVLYVGGLVLFFALTFALIAGCEKLMQFRRGQGARS